MLKKLVALTLAALMLINPMTAMAVSWGEVKAALEVRNTVHKFDDDSITATADDEGNVIIEGFGGSIENFKHSDEFKSYTFKGEIHFNGEIFEVYVKQNSDGTSDKVVVEMGSDVAIHTDKVELKADDGSELEMAGDAFHVYVGGEQQTIVMIGENVVVTAADVAVSAGENAQVEVTVDGMIDNVGTEYERWEHQYDEDGNVVLDENGEPVLVQVTVPGEVSFDAHEDSSLTVDLNGTIATEGLHIRVDENADMDFVNDGEILAQEEVGIYAGENSDGTLDFTNNGEISVNLDTSDDIYDDEVDDDHIGGVMIGSWENATETTFTNSETGVVNGDVTGWLDNTNEGAGITITNQGEIAGNVGAWGQSGEGSISLDNQGEISGELGTFTQENTSTSISNSGTVEGQIWADNRGTNDMTVTNSGDVNDLYVSNESAATTTVTNEGTVSGNFGMEVYDGTLNVTNSGTIDNVGSFHEGYDEEGNLQSWADTVGLRANDNGTLNVTNTGTIETEEVYIRSENDSALNVESSGTIATEEGIVISGEGTIDFSNSGDISTNNDTSDDIVHEDGWVENEGAIWGDTYEGGSLTFTNEEGGEITGFVSMGASGEGTTLDMTNNGTMEYIQGHAGEGATTTITNNNTVTIQMTNTANSGGTATSTNSEGAYAEWMWSHAEEGGILVSVNDGTAGSQGGATWSDDAQITITNNGSAGGMETYLYGDSTATITNNGETEVEWIGAESANGGTVEIINNGTAGYVGAGAVESGSVTVTNNNTVTDAIDVGSYNGGTADIVNDGTAENIYSGAFDGGTTTVTNNNTVNNEIIVDTYNGTLDVTNDGTVGGQLDVWVYGEEGTATATNNGTVGSSEDGNGVWVEAGEGGTVELTNDGVINGEIGGGVSEGSSTTITNNGSAESSWINAHGGDVALNNEGTVSGTLSVSIGTQSNAVTDVGTVSELLKQTGVDISGYESVDIYTANQDGELIARYSVAEDGTVVLEEVLMVEEEIDNDDPAFWTEERIRHQKEEERKAAAIGGVTGSPYRVKQLYLGYMSLNLRLFDGEKQIVFKENLSWVPGTGKAGEKVLTLNVDTEDTSALMMRLDGAVIDKLEQADIVTINIVDGAGNLFMTYQVEDLKGAREMYGLTAAEYIVVGSADADVMKIAEDGTISPIEGETEETETPAA